MMNDAPLPAGYTNEMTGRKTSRHGPSSGSQSFPSSIIRRMESDNGPEVGRVKERGETR